MAKKGKKQTDPNRVVRVKYVSPTPAPKEKLTLKEKWAEWKKQQAAKKQQKKEKNVLDDGISSLLRIAILVTVCCGVVLIFLWLYKG